jgi:hypothetical protein
MASTFINDLRLEEMATGENAGSWGTKTNTNLELIAEAFSFSTEGITTNADTHTTTIADGATDPGRSMYLKYTGTLDSTCTITIGPNTVSKLWFIENGTSGSQDIIIKQGSGTTVTIPSGDTKAIYSDGAGSGGGMVDAFASLNVGAFTSNGSSTITVADNSTALNIVSTDADADTGPRVDLTRNSASPAANDVLGQIRFMGEDAADNSLSYVSMFAQLIDPTDGGEDGSFELDVRLAGSNRSRMISNATETVFNDDGQDINFRIETDAQASAFVIDAANDTITMTNQVVTITHGGNGKQLELVSTDADASSGPQLDLYRNSASPADNDNAGKIKFISRNDNSQDVTYSEFYITTPDVSDGTEDGQLHIDTMVAGTSRSRIKLMPAETVLNENSIDIDFRVESDSNANMLYVDAGNNRIGIANTGYNTTADLNLLGRGLSLKNDLNGNNNNWSLIQNDTNSDQANIKFISGSGNMELTHGSGLVISPGQNGYPFVFNESSKDCDFRVESNNNANMLFVDGGDDHVSIGTGSDRGGVLNVESSDNNYTVMLSCTDDDSNAGPWLGFDRRTGSAADGDTIGSMAFLGRNSAAEQTTYCEIRNHTTDVSDGTEDGQMQFKVIRGGSHTSFLELGGNVDINPTASGGIDFRVRSDSNDNAILLDANDEVTCFGTSNTSLATQNSETGVNITVTGRIFCTTASHHDLNITSDGEMIRFRSAASNEGNISVSGSTVSYNGFAGRHESSGIPTTTAKGTVVSTIDELDVYFSGPKQGQARADHAKVKVSDSEGDACVYGVVGDFTDDGSVNVVSVGIGSILVTGACSKGDLLESNGDGTAKVQSDDIIRSKTIGKVTIGDSNTGVKLVSCVMYCG